MTESTFPSARTRKPPYSGERPDEAVRIVPPDDVGCFQLSNDSCRVLAEIINAARRKAGKSSTEAA
jgi:hypothetical protein